jgi:hypothetical protein
MTYEEYMSEKAFGATYTRGCKDSGVARSTKRVSGVLSWGLDGAGVLELCFICFDSSYGRRGDVKTGVVNLSSRPIVGSQSFPSCLQWTYCQVPIV